MSKGKIAVDKRQQLLIIVLLLAGIITFVSALWPSSSKEPTGWVAVNNQVEQTLAELEQKEESKKPLVKNAAAASIKIEADKEHSQVLNEGTQPGLTGGEDKTPEIKGGIQLDQQQGTTSIQPDGKLDINHATAEQLVTLPGIGEVKARTIVEDREKNGHYRSIEDMRRVKGVGPKLLEKIKISIVALP